MIYLCESVYFSQINCLLFYFFNIKKTINLWKKKQSVSVFYVKFVEEDIIYNSIDFINDMVIGPLVFLFLFFPLLGKSLPQTLPTIFIFWGLPPCSLKGFET